MGSDDSKPDRKVSRRSFIKTGTAITASSLLGGTVLLDLVQAQTGEKPEEKPAKSKVADLCAVTGTSYFDNTIRAVDGLGGISRFVPKDSRVALLANVVWKHPGANVRPEVILAAIKMCRDAGAAEVRSLQSFSGGYWRNCPMAEKYQKDIDAVKTGGGDFTTVDLPKGKNVKQAGVMQELLDCDVLINLAITKNHAGCILSGVLKNMMGGCAHKPTNQFCHYGHNPDAEEWYEDVEWLNQCIADLNFIRTPDLCINDATEFLTTGGPYGPGKIGRRDTIVAGTDPVALDAYCVRFHDLKIEDISILKYAHQHGLGEIDLAKLNISEITA